MSTEVGSSIQRAPRVGVMVALPLNIISPLTIGWSILHPLENKKNFDWNFGTKLAIARASNWCKNILITDDEINHILNIYPNAKIGRLDGPHWIWSQIFDFSKKAKKYFNVKYSRIIYYNKNKIIYLNN